MEWIHAREYLSSDQKVRVDCDTQCNVLLMDDHNYSRYRTGQSCNTYGQYYRYFPAEIPAPRSGHWNIVIDAGGAGFKYNISVVPKSS